jgi:peptidoglycan-associated lipoprotein
VYFAYDSSDLDSRARSSLEASARCLQQRGATARVTGMTDPRGTEEYNLALGDRRARSVKQYLTNLGVDPSRLDVRSVGEEHAAGEDEHGWAQDRRAEIEMR